MSYICWTTHACRCEPDCLSQRQTAFVIWKWYRLNEWHSCIWICMTGCKCKISVLCTWAFSQPDLNTQTNVVRMNEQQCQMVKRQCRKLGIIFIFYALRWSWLKNDPQICILSGSLVPDVPFISYQFKFSSFILQSHRTNNLKRRSSVCSKTFL